MKDHLRSDDTRGQPAYDPGNENASAAQTRPGAGHGGISSMSKGKASGAWKKAGKDRGIYSRKLAGGQVVWGYYSTARGNVV